MIVVALLGVSSAGARGEDGEGSMVAILSVDGL